MIRPAASVPSVSARERMSRVEAMFSPRRNITTARRTVGKELKSSGLRIKTVVRRISTESVNFLLIAVLAVLYYGFSLFIIRKIKDTTPKAMVVPMYFYLFCNSAMNIFAMMQLLSRPSLAAAVAYIGALLFYASDCCLFLVRYGKKPEIIFKKHFTVMLTYLLGEALIVVGIIML